MSISPSEKIKVAIDGNIATVTIDNPAANTWDRESLPALKAVVEALNADLSVYALVLTGAGEKFSQRVLTSTNSLPAMPTWRARG